MKTEKIQGRISSELHNQIINLASKNGATITEILEEALSFYLAKKDDAQAIKSLSENMSYTLKAMHKERDEIHAYLSRISSLIVETRRKA